MFKIISKGKIVKSPSDAFIDITTNYIEDSKKTVVTVYHEIDHKLLDVDSFEVDGKVTDRIITSVDYKFIKQAIEYRGFFFNRLFTHIIYAEDESNLIIVHGKIYKLS